MKNVFKMIGIIAFAAIIGFALIGCPGESGDPGDSGNNPDDKDPLVPTTGVYAGKDVLGNNYSLSIVSNAPAASITRAAAKGDRYTMTVKPRDGKTRTVTGTVSGISADGTLTLETTGDDFAVTVSDGSLNSVAGVGDEMPQIPFTGDKIGGQQTLTPRSFSEINLRATRWTNNTGGSGEHWGSGKSVLLRDYPANVSTLQANSPERYTITISGSSDIALDYIAVEVQGLDEDDNWQWLTGYSTSTKVAAGVPFTITEKLYSVGTTVNLLDYKEIILQVTNVMKYKDANTNTNNGSIPASIEDGTIMATISNFNISLKDTSRDEFEGNMPDFHYGIQEDGMSAAYTQAVWSLTSANITEAKKAGAKFEFIVTGLDDELEAENISLGFAWQDPVRELWWQDGKNITGSVDVNGDDNWVYQIIDGVEWIPWQKKIKIDLASIINDNRFNSATEINFIIGYWWNKDGAAECIDELAISGANIITSPSPNTNGNIGNYDWGYEANGVTANFKQAVWNLSGDILEDAQKLGAKLVIEFADDISSLSPHLVLVWQGAVNNWWPDPFNGNDWTIGHYDETAHDYIFKDGVSYDPNTKKLTIVLEDALEDHSDFITETYANFVLDCWYGVTAKIDELGIISANIVE